MGGAGPDRSSCPGCGLIREAAPGPTHPYILSSPACWALFATLTTLPLVAPGSTQLAIDTYAVQHPGAPERRSIRSVGVHLVSLCAALERDWPSHRATHLIRRAVAAPSRWRWLDPPQPVGTVTVGDILGVADVTARGVVVREWAEDLWGAYAAHHATVRAWLDDVLTAG